MISICSGLGTQTGSFQPFFKIDELEEQCNEIDKERERNAQLSRRLQELETELQDKELVCKTKNGNEVLKAADMQPQHLWGISPLPQYL